MEIYYVIGLCFLALAFDFINGFHDAANSIATIVSTRVLRPFQAVIWAGFWNFCAAWFFNMHVAKTIGKGIVPPESVGLEVLFGALIGAITWNLITWYLGLPTSSSHALVGGLVGSACIYTGKWVVVSSGLEKVLLFIVLSPFIGLVLGWTFMVILSWVFRRYTPAKIDRLFRVVQLGSAACYSLGHGSNDAQKTMGIIAVLLYTTIWKDHLAAFQAGGDFPFWIAIICYAAMGFGTMAGGWRIVKTMGMKITRLMPYGGACAEMAAAISLFGTAAMGIPVSTTHTITGAIVGVGSTRRMSAVRWGVATQVVWAWLLTIPCSAFIAGVVALIFRLAGG